MAVWTHQRSCQRHDSRFCRPCGQQAEELTASVGKITAARDHVREMMAEKRMSLEERREGTLCQL